MSTKLHWKLTDELESTLTSSLFALQLDWPSNFFDNKIVKIASANK